MPTSPILSDILTLLKVFESELDKYIFAKDNPAPAPLYLLITLLKVLKEDKSNIYMPAFELRSVVKLLKLFPDEETSFNPEVSVLLSPPEFLVEVILMKVLLLLDSR